MTKIANILAALSLVAIQAAPTSAAAQEFPQKGPIKLVVATGAGGGSDVLARITADFLQRRLGQAVVVENKPGAAGAIGIDYVAKAAPDGYTLLFQGSDFSVIPAVRPNLPYKPSEFTYLLQAFSIPPVVLGSPSLPAKTVPELIGHMKANPGTVSYGSSGVGGVVHLGIALLENAAGVRGNHIPFTGVSAAYAAMLGGHVAFAEGIVPFPEGLKMLGTAGSKRHPAYPQVPTLEESGIHGATWNVWYGVMAPPNLPKPIRDRLIKELAELMSDPAAIEKFKSTVGFAPELVVGDDFKKAVLAETVKWKAVAQERNIVLQP
ncbi:tripartite tricarboxylate transporter substrate binding protein [Variovorax paradoxus]|nr:tripartite tricarboxylate transporter substrate binding protein [Variovorax paradoxus]MBT2305226.1 tripartite tricarboxylate transporter substrate binding protein [Variovorax paradoxus]